MIQRITSEIPQESVSVCGTGTIHYFFQTGTEQVIREDGTYSEVYTYDFDEATGSDALNALKEKRLRELYARDSSSEVNRFYYANRAMWLDKATRVGLANSTDCEERQGRTVTKLWYGDAYMILQISTVKSILSALEVYALECYNVTAQHAVNIKGLTDIRDVFYYDITANYPPQLQFQPQV